MWYLRQSPIFWPLSEFPTDNNEGFVRKKEDKLFDDLRKALDVRPVPIFFWFCDSLLRTLQNNFFSWRVSRTQFALHLFYPPPLPGSSGLIMSSIHYQHRITEILLMPKMSGEPHSVPVATSSISSCWGSTSHCLDFSLTSSRKFLNSCTRILSRLIWKTKLKEMFVFRPECSILLPQYSRNSSRKAIRNYHQEDSTGSIRCIKN